jgi:hypothetical protein
MVSAVLVYTLNSNSKEGISCCIVVAREILFYRTLLSCVRTDYKKLLCKDPSRSCRILAQPPRTQHSVDRILNMAKLSVFFFLKTFPGT